MRLLISETWRYPIYGQILLERFKAQNIEAFPFKEGEYFKASNGLTKLAARAQNKYRTGPALNRLNRELVKTAEEHKIDTALFVRGDMIYPESLHALKQRGVTILGCNNDNPFSHENPGYLWRHLIGGLPHYDHYFAYRAANVADFERGGCKRSTVLRSYFIKESNFPIDDVSQSPYLCDVSFIGHWENDGREDYVGALVADEKVKFKLWGTLWQRAKNYAAIEQRLGSIVALYGADYNLAINSSKIALVFLSHLNRDTYTRRCFEIPAAQTFMLAPRNDDLTTLFKEGVEAEYYGSIEEMKEKIHYYLAHDEQRKSIARAGRERLLKDGHEASDRVCQIIAELKSSRQGRPQETQTRP